MAYDFNSKNWEEELNAAERRKRAAEAALSGYGSFSYGRESQREGALDALLNREKFKYDLDKDALYKQIRDNYSALGKIAMQDTMGQASAMTGGYGNSYAASAGQQAYNQYMQKAQDTIPQLYQMALDRYNAEGNRLSGNLAALNEDRSQKYGEWQGEYSRLAGDRDYYGSDYNSVYNAAYQLARDKIADEQWERQFAASQRRSSGGNSNSKNSNQNLNNIQAIKTANVEKFLTSIPTENGFNIVKAGGMRGYGGSITNPANAQQQEEYKKYKTYNDFLTAKIDNELANGTMSAGEAAWLIDYYGL